MGKGQKAGLILNIIIPLVAGAILYYYMSADVLFVECADRILCAGSHPVLWKTDSPESRLIRNFLLDMLWGYALIMTLFLLSDNETADLKKVFFIAFLFSAAMELLQLTPMVHGTFDVCDILLEAAAEVIAVFVIKYLLLRRNSV